MSQKVSPTMVVVALLVLAVIVVGIWYFTMGKKTAKKGEPVNAATKQPTTPEAAQAAGYQQQHASGSGVVPGAGGAVGGPPTGPGK